MIRNVRRGLVTRTDIIRLLDYDSWNTTSEITRKVNVTANTVLYHLRNLKREQIVERNSEGKGWRLAPIQQSKLLPFFATTRKRKKRG
jgi:predicted transcriptional regulator